MKSPTSSSRAMASTISVAAKSSGRCATTAASCAESSFLRAILNESMRCPSSFSKS
jgi:hypothetical protein